MEMTTITYMIAIFLALVLGGIGLMVLVVYTKSSRFRVREPTDPPYIRGIYWMIEKRDADGTVWWKSAPWQPKIKIQEPPSECICVGPKGRKFVDGVRLSEDEYLFLKPNKIDAKDAEKHGWKPFSVVHRTTMIQQYKKAQARRSDNWLRENGLNLAMGMMMFVIIILGIIYFGEISQSMLQKEAQSQGFLKEARSFVGELKGEAAAVTPKTANGNTIVQKGEDPPR